MADEIRVDYAQLQQVAAQFARQATAVNQMQQQVKRSMGQLHSAWVGQGSGAFFAEMNDKVLPATNRLYRALQDASKTTRQIAQLMEQAENDAAAPFRTGAEARSAPAQPSFTLLPVVGVIGASIIAMPVIGIISNISRSWTATKTEKDQINTAQKALRDIKGLKPDEWSKLDTAGRTALLNQVEQALAKAEGRPPLQIESAVLKPNTLGEYNGSVLKISESALNGDDIHRILETVAHEGRHAYQDYAVQHDDFHSDTKEVAAWRENLKNYQDFDKVGAKRYWNQPIEQDARHFADQFADTFAPQSFPKEIYEELNEVATGFSSN